MISDRSSTETVPRTNRAFYGGIKLGQRFRAGIEGSISCLKRALGLSRCLSHGWERFASTTGLAVFVHNLLILTRGYG